MKLIVGLGNPDKKYQNTRHNLGQKIIIDYVEKFYKTTLTNKPNLSAKIFEIGQGSNKTIFATPTEYMNNSGITVQKIADFYKISPLNIFIVHDDLDLPVGEYRVQFDRGPAGHNGIKSIVEKLNTQQFHRLRIGIGHSENNIPVEDYVLQNFSQEESSKVSSITPEIFKEIENYISTI